MRKRNVEHKRRGVERVPFSPTVIALDFLLRFLLLDTWVYLGLPNAIFWTMQAVGVTVGVLFLAVRKYDQVLERHRAKYLVVEAGPWTLIFLLFVLMIVTVGAYSAAEDWGVRTLRWIFTVAVFFGYGTYLGALYLLSPADRIWLPPTEEQHTVEHAEALDPIDLNDLRIAKMETDTFSITHRVETYTLESALFGALAFSGFLTLLSGDTPVLDRIRELRLDVQSVWRALRAENFMTARSTMVTRLTPDDVIAAVTVETLVASMLFLLVIISRLRFYNTLKRVDHFVRAARAMNNKEDEVHLLMLEMSGQHQQLEARRAYLTRRVNVYMNDAESSFDDMQPMVRYMSVFRSLGIFMFLLILLTSALIVSTKLNIAFLALAGGAYAYMHLDKRMHEKRFRQMALNRLRRVRDGRARRGARQVV